MFAKVLLNQDKVLWPSLSMAHEIFYATSMHLKVAD